MLGADKRHPNVSCKLSYPVVQLAPPTQRKKGPKNLEEHQLGGPALSWGWSGDLQTSCSTLVIL